MSPLLKPSTDVLSHMAGFLNTADLANLIQVSHEARRVFQPKILKTVDYRIQAIVNKYKAKLEKFPPQFIKWYGETPQTKIKRAEYIGKNLRRKLSDRLIAFQYVENLRFTRGAFDKKLMKQVVIPLNRLVKDIIQSEFKAKSSA